MRLVVQRVRRASVSVGGKCVGVIGQGLLVLVGVGRGDTTGDAAYLAGKTVQLRIFKDAEGKMNRSLMDVQGGVLAISQFTLYGDCRKGSRPSFTEAAGVQEGERLYTAYVQALIHPGLEPQTGRFGADMQIELLNDGPVTLLLESSGRIT